MPTSTLHGTPSAANALIGGIPTIHYLDFLSRGRGQAVRLFFEDAGIAYNDVRYSYDEYPSFKAGRLTELNPAATVPVVELGNGRILTQSYAILRHLGRVLGKDGQGGYEGRTEEEVYFADVIADVVVDWRTLFVTAFFSPNKSKDYPEHCSGKRAVFLQAITRHLEANEAARSGPFVLGERFTYADIVLYQILHDEDLTKDGRRGLSEYPRLVQLVDAVESRPNIKAFLESERYLG